MIVSAKKAKWQSVWRKNEDLTMVRREIKVTLVPSQTSKVEGRRTWGRL